MEGSSSLLAGMVENPEYQKMIRKIASAPPALRAVANYGEADQAFMSDMMNKDLELRKLGTQKKITEGKLANERLGLGTAQTYYNAKIKSAKNSLDLAKNNLKNDKINMIGSGIVGLANVGTGLYGSYQNNQVLSNLLRNYNLTY